MKVLQIFRIFLDDCLCLTIFRGILEPSQTSMMKLICENSKGLKAVRYFFKNIQSKIFSWVLNKSLIFKLMGEQENIDWTGEL